jgi:CubicO group peptidase (beta-lactamase class C family)
VGSITKSMTATLLAVLEEDGLLSDDDAVPALLPEMEAADGWGACTLRHLLTHTAGAPANFPTRMQKVWPDTAEELVAARGRFVAEVLAGEPESPCGERFAYSNVGYTIAGHIAETIVGKPYEALLRERVFVPLNLASAGFGPPRGDAPNQEPIGHVVLLRWFRLRMDPFRTHADNSPVMAPAGTAHMTIGDLARYGAAHLAGESATSSPLLPRAAWQRLHTPFLDDYARGWVRVERDWAGGSVLWHNGSNTLWYAFLMLLPASNTVLAFATNDGAIQVAETAFVDLARELGGPAPAS